ncbi:MAG TPA: hypothetical protein VD865_05475 [Stenotrophomonas sp.]|nr:hypothetical protein [Stenotrophomonas sp.]
MKHGLALLAAGIVLLAGALVVAVPPQALAAVGDACPGQTPPGGAPAIGCELAALLPRTTVATRLYGEQGTAAILLIGGLAALGGAGLALRRERGEQRGRRYLRNRAC